MKRGLVDRDVNLLSALGALTGVNSYTPTSNVWIGSDGAYTTDFTNDSGNDLVLVCWGPSGSWINAVQPLVTTSIANGASQVLSFAEGASGACSAVYPGTTMVNGQLSNTWYEFTFSNPWSTVDVSRLVNMNGNPMTVTTAGGCVADMSQCVFTCTDGASTCWQNYQLLNCNASNGGGTGQDASLGGAASGGCNGITPGSQTKVTLS